eukprot:1324296-Pyramimonas_sp.AAC.1
MTCTACALLTCDPSWCKACSVGSMTASPATCTPTLARYLAPWAQVCGEGCPCRKAVGSVAGAMI